MKVGWNEVEVLQAGTGPFYTGLSGPRDSEREGTETEGTS